MVGDREKIASLTIPPPVISVIFYEESSGSFLLIFQSPPFNYSLYL